MRTRHAKRLVGSPRRKTASLARAQIPTCASAGGQLGSIRAERDRVGHVGAAAHLLDLFAGLGFPQERLSSESARCDLFSVRTDARKDASGLYKDARVGNIDRRQCFTSRGFPDFDRVVFAKRDEAPVVAELDEAEILLRRRLNPF